MDRAYCTRIIINVASQFADFDNFLCYLTLPSNDDYTYYFVDCSSRVSHIDTLMRVEHVVEVNTAIGLKEKFSAIKLIRHDIS
jgi:hypothetical protein